MINMAINNARMQQLRGAYGDFNKNKALPGEFQVVIANDPSVPSGKAVYMAFAAGDVRRLVSIEDIEAMVAAGQFKGEKGDTGPQGPKGDRGFQGETGPGGEKGDTGPRGLKGENGADGKSAYEYARNGGYTGTEQQFYEGMAVLMNIPATEQNRIDNEDLRVSAETKRQQESEKAIQNILDVKKAVEDKLEAGEFIGPQGLKGDTGPQGPKGEDGTVNFEELTEEQKTFLQGKSAYRYAQEGGYPETESEFYKDLAAMQGLSAELGKI